MRILITTDVYKPTINGVVTSVSILYEQLKKQGHDVRILTLSNNARPRKDNDVYYVGALPAFLYPGARMSVRFYHPFVAELLAWNPDIIHTQTEFSTYFFACKLARKLNIPIVHTYHTMYEDYAHYFIKNKKLGRLCVKAYSRLLLSKTEAVVIPTRKVQNVLVDYGIEKEMFKIPTGVRLEHFARQLPDTEKSRLRDSLCIRDDDFVLVTVGRLGKEKNIQELIYYMGGLVERRKNVKLLIVGDGPFRKELEGEVRNLGLNGHVVFAGMVAPDKVSDYYRLGDIFVSASTTETQGLAYIEAMASGLPLICRKDDCLADVIDHCRNGFMYETENEYLAYVLRIIENEDFRMQMRAYACEKSREYTAEGFSEAIEKAYRSICTCRSRRNGAEV